VKDDQRLFLMLLGRPPARLTVEQTAWALACQSHDIPVLVAAKHLKPLGNPLPSSVKYFATVQILEHCKDVVWLAKATNIIQQFWRNKNARKTAAMVHENGVLA
jgi:hypothetical protein